MSVSANDITIAITVFNRRKYLIQCIKSALEQTMPVRVVVIEDCGPDPELQAFAKQEFGSRIEYIRNPRRRGIFGNLNSCIENCQTPWVSILADDDYLPPGFVEGVVDVANKAPGCAFYFGQTQLVSETGEPVRDGMRPPMTAPWRKVELEDALITTPLPFPGHILNVKIALAEGGFNETSQFCGDWELWAELIAKYGAAQTSALTAYNRGHAGPERGGTIIDRNGRLRPLVFVQQKRVLQLMREKGKRAVFDRREFLKRAPMSVDYLLRQGAALPPKIFRYNVGLLLKSTPPTMRYAVFQAVARVLGAPFVLGASRMARAMSSNRS
jgi:hypothetical protein